ncbi:hypothetical protein DFAR_400003 [Desulfarculales bacterium]
MPIIKVGRRGSLLAVMVLALLLAGVVYYADQIYETKHFTRKVLTPRIHAAQYTMPLKDLSPWQ